jgi:rod shape-determining protein MreD
MYGLIALAALLQITVLGRLEFLHAVPDLVFSLVVFFGLFGTRRVACEAGIFAGLLKDIFSLNVCGLNILVLSSVSILINRIAPRFYRESRFAQGFLTAAFYVFAGGAYYALTIMASGASGGSIAGKDCFPSFLDLLASSIVPGALYTSLASIVVCGTLMEWHKVRERFLF